MQIERGSALLRTRRPHRGCTAKALSPARRSLDWPAYAGRTGPLACGHLGALGAVAKRTNRPAQYVGCRPTRRASQAVKRAQDRKRVGTEEELRQLVRALCEREYLERIGKAWDERFHWLGKGSNEAEKEARAALVRLRSALMDVAAVARKPEIKRAWGRAVHSLRDLVERDVKRMLQTGALRNASDLGLRHRWGPLREGRAQLVHVLDRYDVLGLTPYEGGPSRFLTLRELAIVSLLVGNWPALPEGPLNYTPADVIEEETKRIRRHRRHMLPGVTDAERGPREDKPKKR